MCRALIALTVGVLIAGGLTTTSAGEKSRPKMVSKEAREDKKISRTSKEKKMIVPPPGTNIKMDGADR